tara:strand:+ start:1842 stop:2324 length:483 start_codon:yes stop_codon:yes gene_type:complete
MVLTRKEQLIKELKELEDPDVEDVEDVGEIDEPIQAEKVVNEPIDDGIDVVIEPIQKVKKPRSAKQIEAFAKAKVVRDANAVARKVVRETKSKEDKKVLEDKIVKKALAVKRRQIKAEKALEVEDEIEEEEPDIQAVKITNRGVPKPQLMREAQPKYFYY